MDDNDNEHFVIGENDDVKVVINDDCDNDDAITNNDGDKVLGINGNINTSCINDVDNDDNNVEYIDEHHTNNFEIDDGVENIGIDFVDEDIDMFVCAMLNSLLTNFFFSTISTICVTKLLAPLMVLLDLTFFNDTFILFFKYNNL